MTHLLFLVEGYCEEIDRLVKNWHGKIYANGKAKLRMREVRFFTSSINEVGVKEFLSDFESFSGGNWGAHGKFKIFSLLRPFCRLMGINSPGKVESSGLKGAWDKKTKDGRNCETYNVHFVLLGEVKDPRVKEDCPYGRKGEELV
jgi:hypothetical protein